MYKTLFCNDLKIMLATVLSIVASWEVGAGGRFRYLPAIRVFYCAALVGVIFTMICFG
jgi:hypothetical protein